MKKLFLMGILCILVASQVRAETISGKVTGVRKNTITVRTEDGEKMTLQTTDNTSITILYKKTASEKPVLSKRMIKLFLKHFLKLLFISE